MLGENLRPVADSCTTRDPSRTGTVVALRPIRDVPHSWEPAPRRMAILALDSGQWAFAWVHGCRDIVPGLRVQFREHPEGTRFATFFPLSARS